MPASAEPPGARERIPPLGAAETPPDQPSGSADGRSHQVDAAATSAAGGAAEAVAAELEPPEVPGAAAAEPERFPDVELPSATTIVPVQDVDLSMVEVESDGYVEGVSVEDVTQRQPDSQVFWNPDGTETLRVYNEVAFVPDPQTLALAGVGLTVGPGEHLASVDPTLHERSDGRVAPVRAVPVSFGERASDPELARIELSPTASIAFGLDEAAAVDPELDGATVTYPAVRANADVRFTVSASGFKEDLILHSADAPSSWRFPLALRGVSPSLTEDGRSVVFTDSAGDIQGYIPPGFMIDSNIHPRRGDGEVSHDVTYTLLREGETWILQVDLDEDWLRHPSRVFPVYVDPTYQRNADSDDTFVSSRDYANQDNSWRNDLKVGTYDGGGNREASYLHFNGLLSARPNRWVHGATFNVYNYWSYSCTARPVDLYRVTKSWSGPTTTRWAGPSYDSSNRLARSTFAYGYTSCPQGGWGTFTLPADRVMRWLHGTETFHGLTMRASETDSRGWKRFWSANYGTSSARPYIDLNYSNQGAKYSLPSGVFNPPVTGSSAGRITVRVTNWGMTTWTPSNGYRLRVQIRNSSGTVVQSVPYISMPRNVGPHTSVDIPVQVAALSPGSYTMRIYMVTPDNTSFQSAHSVPYAQAGFTVANGAPTIVGNWPAHNGYVDTLRPTLWSDYYDPDNHPNAREFRYRVCVGAPDGGGACQTSAWSTSATWRVPAGVAQWYQPTHWYVRVSDTQSQSPWIGPFVFTPTVAQPPITSHLAGAAADADVPGINPLVGNYSTTLTDASVAAAGPPLEIVRTYNSQDPRRDGAFGPGWSSPIDQRVEEDSDGSGNAVVTLTSGRQLRFGRSPDGSYAPPPGANLTLVRTQSPVTWTLRDAAGTLRLFDADGRLTSLADTDGRVQSYTYGAGDRLSRIEDESSGRGLNLDPWTELVHYDQKRRGQ